jgi:putative ABC transport system substrate-binding protein
LIPLGDPLIRSQRERIVAFAAKSRLPTMYNSKGYVRAGGLISYGIDAHEVFRRSAMYMDRILKGADPGSLPVEQPTKFELVINLKTAKALGLEIPPAVLARADEVIE